MKLKILITAAGILLYSNACLAQDYYSGKTTVSGNNYIYNIEQDESGFYLTNANNELTNLYPDPAGRINFTGHDATYRAFRETFTAAELSEFQRSDESI